MLTESQNLNTADIDQHDTQTILQRINAEDAKVAAAVRMALPQIAAAVDAIVPRLEQGGRLVYVGAGTSGRLGVLDAAECVPTFNTPVGQVIALIAGGADAMTRAIEGAEDDPIAGADALRDHNVTPDDIVVGIAASGRTPYVLGAVMAAAAGGIMTIGIACNMPSPLLEAVHLPIGVPVGAEVITGSTRMKAGTAQKLILNMISTTTMIRLGKVYGNLMVDVRVTNQKLLERAKRILIQVTGVAADTADALLVQADHEVKVAIVMARLGIDVEEARDRLSAARGHLRAIIG